MTSSLRTIKYYINREQSSREYILLPFSGIYNSAIKVNRERNINQTQKRKKKKEKKKKKKKKKKRKKKKTKKKYIYIKNTT